MPHILLFAFFLLSLVSLQAEDAFREVSFSASDGGKIHANLYGSGDHAVVLAHGGVFNKESWHSLATAISKQKMQALAIDFRGYGKSQAGTSGRALHLDLLAAVEFLKAAGVERISMLGGSMGGAAAATAAAEIDDLNKLILLAPAKVESPKKLKGDKLFIASMGDRFRSSMEVAFRKAKLPKKIILYDGNAHAQHLFKTDHEAPLRDAILAFLNE